MFDWVLIMLPDINQEERLFECYKTITFPAATMGYNTNICKYLKFNFA